MNFRKWHKWEGDNFEIGYKLGLFWGDYLNDWPDNKMKNDYKKWLTTSPGHEIWDMVANVGREYPQIIEEINGMVAGVRDSKLYENFETSDDKAKPNFGSIFSLILGETDEEVLNCSSLTSEEDGVMVLGHNEEDDKRYPLCYSVIKLKNKDKTDPFISISHPFQLFGSSCGATPKFAFSGNSIGLGLYRKMVLDSLAFRLPKTVLSRMLLEQKDVESSLMLLRCHHSTLPNHWFFCSREGRFSVQMRVADVKASTEPSCWIVMNKASDVDHDQYSTNHFIFENNCVDDKYVWQSRSYQKSSEKRLKNLKSLRKIGSVEQTLKALRESYKKYTSATVIFKINKNEIVCKATSYLNSNGFLIEKSPKLFSDKENG